MSGIVRLMEGQVRLRLVEISVHLMLFPLQEFVNGGVEFRPRQPVGGIGVGGFEAAANLVFPLGTGVEVLQSGADAVLDALVITGLEMQAVELLYRAPVPAIERVTTLEADGRRHGLAAVEGE